MRRDTRLAVVALVVLVSTVILAGGIAAGRLAGFDDPDELTSAIGEGVVVRIADIEASGGQPGRGVFVQSTSTGHLCLWDAPSASSPQRGGGCNYADDPLGGRALSASLSYEGGPGIRKVTDARLIGLVSEDVASVELLMSDGTRRSVPMRHNAAVGSPGGSFRVFGYRVRATDLRHGIGPTAVLALDVRGAEIDRQATGLAGG